MMLPLLGATLIALIPSAQERLVKQVALATTLVVAVATLFKAMSFDVENTELQFRQSYSWIPSFGINWGLGVDGIALVLILMSVILAPLVILGGWNESEGGRWGVKTFYILILVLETMVIGVFAATDLFLFYVFFEAMLIPIYFLLGGYGSGERAAAAVKFLLYSLFGGLLMLASIIGLIVISGQNGGVTFDITELSELHTLMSSTTLSLISILYGAFLAIGAKDIKRLIAYTSISHFGFITLGIFAMTTQSQSGATLYMFNHGFSTAALFFVAGWMIIRRGSSTISDFGGLQRVTPIMAWSFFIAGLSGLALPGLSSFVSEFLVLVGTYTRYPAAAIIATFGIVLAALYILIPVQRALHGETTPGNENLKDLNLREKITIAPVIAIIVFLGFYPSPLLKIINPAAAHIVQQQGYSDPAPTMNGGK